MKNVVNKKQYEKLSKETKSPTINIAYSVNHDFFDLCFVSIVSILKNRGNEEINIIILYNKLLEDDIKQIDNLQKKYKFSYIMHYIKDELFNNFPLVWTTKETWYRCLLADDFPNLDKILYLDCDTIVRKSLLSLWKTEIDGKLIAAVEDVSSSKDKANKLNLKDNFYFNAGVLLINTKEWRKQNLLNKIKHYVKEHNVFQADQGTLNALTDMQKVRLSPEFNFMEVWWRENKCQYDDDDMIIYEKNDPTIVHFTGPKPNSEECRNSYKKEYLEYYNTTLEPDNLIVSLTSYPARIKTVHLVIESLLNQSMPANKLILWLAEEQFPNKEKDLPEKLLKLRSRGLTIDWYHDIKSYKKLIPTLKKYPDCVIVTADDDNLYAYDWLVKLYSNYLRYPNDISAHRITQIYYDNFLFKAKGGAGVYYPGACYLNKLVGLGGVIYPPHCFYKDILDEKLMMTLAPTNDDQWFWLQALLNGVKVRVVDFPNTEEHIIKETQKTGLYNINDLGQNLFWQDFNNMLKYYPKIKNVLINEIKNHSIFNNSITNSPMDIQYKLKPLQKIFSVRNSSDKKHKVITILGVKIKVKIKERRIND